MRAALEQRAAALAGFVDADGERLVQACLALARSLSRGGTLLVHGSGSAASDAAHVVVELLHPVVVGKRALPAVALRGPEGLGALARGDDAVLVLAHGAAAPDDEALLADARRRGLLTLAMTGAGPAPQADHAFVVPSEDRALVQEVQETAYHVLWELSHVFLDRPGLLDEACLTCGDVAVQARVVAVAGQEATVERGGGREAVAVDLLPDDVAVGDVLLCHAGVAIERVPPDPTAFLYPFLDPAEDDLGAVLADALASTRAKAAETTALRAGLDLDALAACAADVRARLQAGGRLLAMGNGGSATDAQDVVHDASAAGWPAVALSDDSATVTAVANDVGFEHAFARQLIALGRQGDVAVVISTSGSSANAVAALREARRRGLLTVAVLGGDGGRAAALTGIDHTVLVRGDYVPRLQEAQGTALHLLLEAVGRRA